MKTLIRFIVMVAAIMAMPYIIAGITVSGWYAALMTAVILAVLNLLVKPVLKLITLPINILTLGLFGLVINALILWFVASFVQGFDVASFGAAFLGALFLAVINWLAHLL